MVGVRKSQLLALTGSSWMCFSGSVLRFQGGKSWCRTTQSTWMSWDQYPWHGVCFHTTATASKRMLSTRDQVCGSSKTQVFWGVSSCTSSSRKKLWQNKICSVPAPTAPALTRGFQQLLPWTCRSLQGSFQRHRKEFVFHHLANWGWGKEHQWLPKSYGVTSLQCWWLALLCLLQRIPSPKQRRGVSNSEEVGCFLTDV